MYNSAIQSVRLTMPVLGRKEDMTWIVMRQTNTACYESNDANNS